MEKKIAKLERRAGNYRRGAASMAASGYADVAARWLEGAERAEAEIRRLRGEE